MPEEKTGEIEEIEAGPEIEAGRYANSIVIGHTADEFILDFFMVTPPVKTKVARIIISPRHTKRLVSALRENFARYENTYGTVKKVPEEK